MKESAYKSYEDLPLFLNAELVAQVLGISQAGAYDLLHSEGFPVLKIGTHMVVPKENSASGWKITRGRKAENVGILSGT